MLPLVAVLAVVALFVCGQQAQAAENHHPKFAIKIVPHQPGSEIATPSVLTPNLYGVSAASAYTQYPNNNSDGSDLWPCFGSYDGTHTSTENPDCPTVGDPKQGFPAGGAVLGTLSYSWPLAACNATSTTSPECMQTNTWYEDDSGDSTDELLYIVEATQGSTVLADSGTVDFGPNAYGGLSPAADVIIYGDQNLGDMGISGPNNGNCEAAYNYPLASPANPGGVYVVPAGKTCGVPTTGAVKFSATTEVGKPAYTKVTHGTVDGTPCTVAAPCYTVKWTKVYSVAQSWTIWLY